jgi:hypothetical protein
MFITENLGTIENHKEKLVIPICLIIFPHKYFLFYTVIILHIVLQSIYFI